MTAEMKQLRGAQLRLEQQQQEMRDDMHRMQEALTAKLDALLVALKGAPAPSASIPAPGVGGATVAQLHAPSVSSLPEPEPERVRELTPLPVSVPEGDPELQQDGGDKDMQGDFQELYCKSDGADRRTSEAHGQEDVALVQNEGSAVCDSSADAQNSTTARPTRRVKLADLQHNKPAGRPEGQPSGDTAMNDSQISIMSAHSESGDIGDRLEDSQVLTSDDSNDPCSSMIYDQRSAAAVQLVRDATLWVGNLPEVALRGLSTQGSCAVSALFPGRDVVAVTVRRKEDIGLKRKSWALVTFGTKQLAESVLEESMPQRDAVALWKLGAAGANMMRRPSMARTTTAEMASAEEKHQTEKKKRRLTMTLDGVTFTLSVKKYSTRVQQGKKGAMSSILRAHILRATEACGEFALPIIAAKTGKIVSITVTRKTTIINVKRRLYNETQEFPPHLQRLRRTFVNGTVRVEDLEDDLTLGECGVFPGGPRIELSVKTSLQDLCCAGQNRRNDARSEEEKQEEAERQRTVVVGRSDAVKGGYAVMSFIPGRRHYWMGMTLHPDGDARQRWDFLVAMLVVLSVALIPLTVAFQEELDAHNLVGFSVVERVIDALFCLHIILNFRTAIIHERCLVTDARTIAWSYFKGWFWMDLVASFPFDIFMHTEEAGSKASGGFRLARLVRLGRLVRVASFARMRMSSNGMRLLKLVFYLITLAHWLGCAWYFVSKIEGFRDDNFSVGGKDQMMECQQPTLNDGDVVQCEPIDDLWAIYLFAFHWGLASLASLGGDLRPATVPQVFLAILVNILGFYVTSYIMGQVYSIILNLDVANNHFISMIQDTESWFKLRQFPVDLREQINRYLVHNFDTTKGMDELQLLKSLPRRLRQDVQYYLNRELVSSLPLLHGMDDRIVLSISDKLQREVCMPGDAIIRQGDIGDEMYFISSGECECTVYGRGVVAVKRTGEFFGEIALFMTGMRTATVTARTLCELMVLTKTDLDLVADVFSELKTSIETVASDHAKRSAKASSDSLSKSMSRASFFSIDSVMGSSFNGDKEHILGSPTAADGTFRAASSWDLAQQHAASVSSDSHESCDQRQVKATKGLTLDKVPKGTQPDDTNDIRSSAQGQATGMGERYP